MKGLGPAVITAVLAVALAGCGGDNTTQFVLSSASASASRSAAASPSAGSSASPTSSSLPATAVTPMPDGSKIIIDSPDASTTISSPVEVSGTASVTNGTVIAVVRDAAGNELGRATTTASASRPDFGHYDVTVTFSGATSGAKGQIRVFDTGQHNYYFIAVRFA